MKISPRQFRMRGARVSATLVGALLMSLALASAASATVGQSRTAGNSYDRNSSVVEDGSLTYLFFVRTQNPCNRLAGCDPDNGQKYDLYMKVSPDGGKTYGPAQFVANNPEPGSDYRGRTIAATRRGDGTIFVFWADGGSQRQLYYVRETAPNSNAFTPTAAQVNGPSTDDVFNVEAVTKAGQILLYTEESEPSGYGVYARSFSEPTASASNVVELDRNIPKAIVDNAGIVRMTYVRGSGYPDVNVYVESSTDGLLWGQPGQVVVSEPGVSNWDPNLIQAPNGQYYLHFAPDHQQGRQEIALTKSNDFVRWTTPHEISPAFKGGTDYWDYWPEGALRGNQVVLYYTSERGFDAFPTGTGHIWTDPGFGGLN
jgi:hypothetical protein